MANRTERPFVTVHLRLSESEYAALREKKEKETWETFFLRISGVSVT